MHQSCPERDNSMIRNVGRDSEQLLLRLSCPNFKLETDDFRGSCASRGTIPTYVVTHTGRDACGS